VFEAFPIIFGEIRGFSISQTGLVFLFVGLGGVISMLVDVFLGRKYPALVKKWRGSPPPEKRLYGAMIAGPSFALSIFWLGWSGNYVNVSWIVPALSSVLIGFSVSLIFNSFMVGFLYAFLFSLCKADVLRLDLPC
jgi:MFS transporter, DHA1 family, multidrug resistance protein